MKRNHFSIKTYHMAFIMMQGAYHSLDTTQQAH